MINTMEKYVAEDSPLIAEARRRRLAKPFVAYIAATAWHETGHVLKPVTENLNYSAERLQVVFKKYFRTKSLAERYARKPEMIANRVYANRMGNGDEASGDGWRFRGRGYVQMTGRDNYRRFGQRIGIDLETNPELASDPEIAMRILFEGMMDGVFTGSGLRQWIKPGIEHDYVGARRVVNGQDRAEDIAKYAEQFEKLLEPIDLLKDSRTIREARNTKRKAGAGAVLTLGTGAVAAGEAILGNTDSVTGAAALGAKLGEYMPYAAPVLIFAFAGLFVWMQFRANKIEALRREDAER